MTKRFAVISYASTGCDPDRDFDLIREVRGDLNWVTLSDEDFEYLKENFWNVADQLNYKLHNGRRNLMIILDRTDEVMVTNPDKVQKISDVVSQLIHDGKKVQQELKAIEEAAAAKAQFNKRVRECTKKVNFLAEAYNSGLMTFEQATNSLSLLKESYSDVVAASKFKDISLTPPQ